MGWGLGIGIRWRSDRFFWSPRRASRRRPSPTISVFLRPSITGCRSRSHFQTCRQDRSESSCRERLPVDMPFMSLRRTCTTSRSITPPALLCPTRDRARASGKCADHRGVVRVRYKVFGDQIDGTFLGIDPTHAHINIPAALMWARGLEERSVRVMFDGHAGWKVATQLKPTDDPSDIHRAEPALSGR